MVEPLARPRLAHRVTQALGRSRVTALLGPRQCGKTTLARLVTGALQLKATWLDLGPTHYTLADRVTVIPLGELPKLCSAPQD
jgi:predicted AAA+ superfamily ATPase